MSRLTVVAVAAGVVSLAVPAIASAKGDATATISSPTRCDASPGTRITIRFHITYRDADGSRKPFGAAGIFVKLSRTGRPAIKRPAESLGARTGRYRARITVPRGEIRRIDVGLEGTSYDADGTPHAAPALFRIVGDPCRLSP